MASKIGVKRKSEAVKLSSKTTMKVSKKENKVEDMTKKELLDKFKILEAKYDKILKEKEILELKFKNINEVPEKKNMESSVGTQTESDDGAIEIACKVCIFGASCVDELVWHIQTEHGIEPEHEYNYSCNICRKPFNLKSDLMFHVKREHTESMPLCKYYQTNECRFSEEKCWYHHKKESNPMNQYKCRICGNTFETKPSFMNHRKGEHHEEVKECVNHKNGMCRFNERCWYIHSDDTEMSFSEY